MGSMYLSVSDQMVSDFLSGLIAVFALVAVGGILSIMLGRMAKRFPFTRLALVLALSPLSLVHFMERTSGSTLYLYAMIVLLLGITIDGIAYLLEPKAATNPEAKAEPEEQQGEASGEPNPGMIVWEKAE